MPNTLTALEAARAIANGDLTSEKLLRACLDRVDLHEAQVGAWASLNVDLALEQARARDKQSSRGLLHGVPVAIKDIIYTEDFPTQHNSPVYNNYWPKIDAACISLLKSAGAVIMGKTTTVEFASLGQVPETTNPYDARRTPGGSSCGSAAAVADFMVPLALGTQTGGSTIRPASFCGLTAIKPSYGLISVEGVRAYAPSLDTLGLFARTVTDLDLLFNALCPVNVKKDTNIDVKLLRIGICRTPMWDEAEPAAQQAVELAAQQYQAMGSSVKDVMEPEIFKRLTAAQDMVMHGEGRRTFQPIYQSHFDLLHQEIKDEVENVRGITPTDLRDAYDTLARGRVEFDGAFSEFDVWITPAVVGEATEGLESTGDAKFNRMWTALHVPAITVPLVEGENDMPVGVQLIAPRFEDARLLAIANLLEQLHRVAT